MEDFIIYKNIWKYLTIPILNEVNKIRYDNKENISDNNGYESKYNSDDDVIDEVTVGKYKIFDNKNNKDININKYINENKNINNKDKSECESVHESLGGGYDSVTSLSGTDYGTDGNNNKVNNDNNNKISNENRNESDDNGNENKNDNENEDGNGNKLDGGNINKFGSENKNENENEDGNGNKFGGGNVNKVGNIIASIDKKIDAVKVEYSSDRFGQFSNHITSILTDITGVLKKLAEK